MPTYQGSSKRLGRTVTDTLDGSEERRLVLFYRKKQPSESYGSMRKLGILTKHILFISARWRQRQLRAVGQLLVLSIMHPCTSVRCDCG